MQEMSIQGVIYNACISGHSYSEEKREDVVDASSKVLWLKFDMGNNRS
jgi:uncharacterized protein YsxB (DUF464 family)